MHTFDIRHGDIRAVCLYRLSSNICLIHIIQDNVLVSDKGRALLHDFGLSTIATDDVKIDDKVTNHRWVAPELKNFDESKGPRKLTESSDMYAFGCLLYEVSSDIASGNIPVVLTSFVLR